MGMVSQTTILSTLSPSSVITKYSTELRRKAIASDLYTALKGENVIYKGQTIGIPDGIYTKISAKDSADGNSIRVTLKLPVNANILRGRAVAVGQEAGVVLRAGTLYRNNYRFVVQAEPGYGEDKLDAAPYALYQEHVRDLAPHAKAEEGLEIRMALVESFGWNLMAGSTVLNCVPQWNKNCFVIGATTPNQPVFHSNMATYTNRIMRTLDNASGGRGRFTQSASQMLTCSVLDQIIQWAFRRRMMPLTIAGRSAFVLTVSQLGAARFSSPSFVDTLGSRWSLITDSPRTEIQTWPGLIGKYIGPSADVYITVDDRLPTILPIGSAQPFSMVANYVWPTDNDLRNLDNPIIRDCYILHGTGALVNWEAEAMHMITDDYDYGIRNGKGYAGVRGIQQLQYDTTPASTTGTAREYFGSALVIAGRYEDLPH